MSDTIGGFDTGGGIPAPEVTTAEEQVAVLESYFISNLALSNAIYAFYAALNAGALGYIWFVHLQ